MKLKRIYNKIISMYNYYYFHFIGVQGISIAKSARILGPINLKLYSGSHLIIKKGVILNSSNINYHVNIYSPMKILTSSKKAIIIIGENTRIHGSCIHAREKISIGQNCLIAANCQIFDSSGHNLNFDNVENRINTRGSTKPIIIEDCVWIGTGSIILPGVKIGYGSVIAAGCVVNKNIPPMSIAGGNPVQIIKTYN